MAEELGELVEAAGMSDILALPKARVPVVKFTLPGGEGRVGAKVDVTVNNMLACINTKLLADYCAVDPRLAQLVRRAGGAGGAEGGRPRPRAWRPCAN